MSAPTDDTTWGTDGAADIAEPSGGQKATGFVHGKKAPAHWMNWWMRAVYRWIAYYGSKDLADGIVGLDSNKRAAVSSTTGDAITGASGGGNGKGLVGTGNGTGAGVTGTGGGTDGTGVAGTGGATNGKGVTGTGAGTGAGVAGTGGASSGTGVTGTGGSTNGKGVVGTGTGTGSGVEGTGGGSNGIGVKGTASGTGAGVSGIGGVSNGVEGTGGSASGSAGVNGVSGNSNGHGVIAAGASAAVAALKVQKGSGTTDAATMDGSLEMTQTNPSGTTAFSNRLTKSNIIKAYANVSINSSGVVTMGDAFNITSVAGSGGGTTGPYARVTLASAMAGTSYAVIVCEHNALANVIWGSSISSSTVFDVFCLTAGGSPRDLMSTGNNFSVIVVGLQ